MKSVKYQACNHVEGRVLRNLWSQVNGEVCFLVRYHIFRQVRNQVWDQVSDWAYDQVNNEIS
jgi:hypothetical protein